MKPKVLFLAVSLSITYYLLPITSFAQDLHFSQFTQTPSLINPALTGATNTLRASVIYKDQWGSVTVPYKTFGASFEMKFNPSNWEKVEQHMTKIYKKSFARLAGGLSFYNDKAGDGNMGTSEVNFSLASFVPINQKNSISVGLQASVVQRTIDFSKLIFPDQYNGSTYDPNISNGENAAAQNFIYPDFAAGINWSYGYSEKASVVAKNIFKSNVGFSVYHINEPNQHYFTDNNGKLDRKYILHGDFAIGIKDKNISLDPSYLVQLQGPSKEVILGMMCKYYFKEDSKYTGFIKRSGLGFGAAYRSNDAIILSTLFESGQYAVGFSYDVNISGLSVASSAHGGPEIFIRFVTPSPFLNQMSTRAKYNLN
jgi:type IX secretion system PorP/SprF family membrane protein